MGPEHIEQAVARLADFASIHKHDSEEELEDAGRLMHLGVGLNPETKETFLNLLPDNLLHDFDPSTGQILRYVAVYGLLVGLSASQLATREGSCPACVDEIMSWLDDPEEVPEYREPDLGL
ncbi:MAG: hypothetical protein ACRDMH_03260 [Solirubrobacterales bacterium]